MEGARIHLDLMFVNVMKDMFIQVMEGFVLITMSVMIKFVVNMEDVSIQMEDTSVFVIQDTLITEKVVWTLMNA